jgi:hypothetical protein
VAGRALLALGTVGVFGALSAIPAAADPPTVTGTAAVGGTLTVSSDEHTQCDGESASVALRRPTGPNTSVTIIIGSAPLVLGQPWSIPLTIPATDLGGTALTPGTQIRVDAGGICFAFGDQATFQMDEVLLTLGQPVTAPSSTTTVPQTSTTVTAPPQQSPTTAVTAAASPTTAVAAAADPGASADATLPRTGSSDTTGAVVGVLALVVGGCAVASAARTSRRNARMRRSS